MQLTQKHLIGISVVAILAIVGYSAFQNFTPSPSDDMTNTGANTISQSGIEIDTGKRLETAMNSGTQWGMTPFGSGKPIEEGEKKPEFKKPNLEWKTRTINGITYVFGEGNPKEVALDENGIQEMADTCSDMPPSIDIKPTNKRAVMLQKNGFCNVENDRPRYLSKQVEYHLLMALSSSDWQNLYEKCEANIRFGNSLHNGSSDPYLTFDQVFFSGVLDINNFILIDPETGLKKLNTDLTGQLIDFLEGSKLETGRGEIIINPHGDCIDIHSEQVLNHLHDALYNYNLPLGSINSDFRL